MTNNITVNSPEISVIVPVYNAQQYLQVCLDSILGQTQKSLEVICVNDGSSDNSMEIIKRLACKDPRVIVLDKENTGYGDSVNQGLQHARGNYVGIIESDDFTDADMFKKLFAIGMQNDADIVKSDFFEYVDGVSSKANIIPSADANKLISPCDDFAIFKAQPSIWSAIYARAFLKKRQIMLTNSPGASFQDTAFNLKTLATSDRVWLTQDAYVHYRRDNYGSSIHSSDKIFTVCDEYDDFERYMDDCPERMARIKQPLQAVKFETYSWNLSRLNGQDQQDFFSHMHRTFVSLHDQGFICNDDFAPEDIPLLKLLLEGNQDFIRSSIEARTAKYTRNNTSV